MRSIQSIYYPEGVAPFGEMEMRRGHYMDRAYAMQRVYSKAIFERAWGKSDWFQSLEPIVSDEMLKSVSERIGTAIRTHKFSTNILSSYIQTKAAWFALSQADNWVDPRTYGKRDDTYWGVHIEGFALAKNDVSGTWRQRTMKRLLARDKVYACVSDVNVEPDRQRQKVGVALFDAALRSFKSEQKATTYVFAGNAPLIAKLGEIGFRETGSHTRTDLFENEYPIEEVRLQAENVGGVINELHDHYPWMGEGLVSTSIYSKVDTLTLPYA